MQILSESGETFGLMTRQRWSGKRIISLWVDQCTLASRLGTKPQCTLRCCITSCHPTKPHHLLLYPVHPHLHSCFDSLPKPTANYWQPRSSFPWRQAHGSGLDDLDPRGKTKKPIQSRPQGLDAGRAFCRTLGWNTSGKKISSAQDLSHPINQVILTHPVTRRRPTEQRGYLSEVQRCNRGVM